MAWYRNMRMVGKIVLPVTFMLILALGGLTWQIQTKSSSAIRSVAERELAALASQHGNAVKLFFEMPMTQAQTLADATAAAIKQKRPISRELYLAMLRGIEQSTPITIAAGAAFEPNIFDGDDAAWANTPGSDAKGRFIPYLSAGSDVVTLEDLETSDYYAKPKQRVKSFLTRPYPYTVNGRELLMSTSSAVIKVDGKFLGIVLVDTPIENIAERVNKVKVYASGAASLLA